MGAVADACLDHRALVTGVMPKHLVDAEIAHPRLTTLDTVETMYERKERMSELADAFVFLPGGAGTLDEFFDAWTTQQLGLHRKPIALLGKDFWGPTLEMLDHIVSQGFIRVEDRQSLVVEDTPSHLLETLQRWQAPTPKWQR